jgi:predicted N-acyltransferase
LQSNFGKINDRRNQLNDACDHHDDDDDLTSNIGFELISSINEIPEVIWDNCLDHTSSPFLQHAWLRCLEEGGCATVATGWMPSHIQIKFGENKIIGFVPLYVKNHSMGEFIFDRAWAEAAQRNGIQY